MKCNVFYIKMGYRWLIYIVSFLLLVSTFFAIQQGNYQIPKYWFFIILLLEALFVYLLTRPFIQCSSIYTFLVISTLAIVILRLFWILEIPTLPASDFEFYNSFAIQIVQQKSSNYPPTMYSLGYPIVLSIIYKIFGVHIIIAKLLNIVLSIFTGMLLFLIARNLFDEYIARITMILFILWPAQIMMNSVLASENMFVVLLLLGLLILLQNLPDKESTKTEFYGILIAGAILGLSYTMRSISIIIVAVIFLMLMFSQGCPPMKRAGKAIIMMIGFIIVVGVYIGTISFLVDSSTPPSLFAHSLMVGSNKDSRGMWNVEDDQVWVRYGNEEGKRIAFQRAYSRIMLNPLDFAALVFEKFSIMWGDDSYGAYWSTLKMDITGTTLLIEQNPTVLYSISQFFYILILFFSAIGCYKLLNEQVNIGLSLLLSIFLAFVILHSFLEVQSRYHYPAEFILLILAGYGIARSISNHHSLVIS